MWLVNDNFFYDLLYCWKSFYLIEIIYNSNKLPCCKRELKNIDFPTLQESTVYSNCIICQFLTFFISIVLRDSQWIYCRLKSNINSMLLPNQIQIYWLFRLIMTNTWYYQHLKAYNWVSLLEVNKLYHRQILRIQFYVSFSFLFCFLPINQKENLYLISENYNAFSNTEIP